MSTSEQMPSGISGLRRRTREDSQRVMRLGVDKVQFHPKNIRRDLGDLTELVASIREHGILQPLVAERCEGYVRLLMGHRRLAAAHAAGLRSVPVVVVRSHADDEAIVLMLTENTRRDDLSRADRAAAIRDLLDNHDYSRARVATVMGVSGQTISNWLEERDTDPAATPAPRTRAQAKRQRAPIGLVELHELVTDWDSGSVDIGTLVGRLRAWLGNWQPEPTTEDLGEL